ncbi:chromosome segregation protein SMC [Polynucleobacter rarus]|uniref:chromosome segregation protein SMC n=1 Tax=Polynucleobacter rarus TaxID=556055 RepID=UPI000D3E7956|nr:chromosome segregation protein SMC [Polynucleobacter rarus]
MRLRSIKLAGFKSFVDPTNFDLPGQLIGVVGPNGCGKSNIIDAVRWVLGESRASELRGESMQDVIFNGSGLRKPSGRASVELVFDNTDGKAQGQWAAFGEISVKRVLTRDGTSNYLINQQNVRRKDIQDMFLGTGLGPRAYAIIGQGMISRIIEAKPEELRIFLEEAAGVSKYKERRRETESRIESTQENLTRVRDVLRELDSQLVKLESQAEVAEKFQTYQKNMTEKQHLLWLMRKIEGEQEQNTQAMVIREQQLAFEELTAKLRSVESELESKRSLQFDLQNEVNDAQGKLYEVNALISQIESEIRFNDNSKQRLTEQLADLANQQTRWDTQLQLAQEQIGLILEEIEEALEKEATYQELLAQHLSEMSLIEEQWNTSKGKVESTRQAINHQEKEIARLSAVSQGISNQTQQTQQRIARLKIDLDQLIKPDEEALGMAIDRNENAIKKRDEAQLKQQQAEANIPQAEEASAKAQEVLLKANAAISQTQAKLNALKNIQAQIQAQGKLKPWLDKNNLANLPRLWQKIQVETGWEPAIEAILHERLGAIESSQLEAVLTFVDQKPPGRVAWFEHNTQNESIKSPQLSQFTPFASRVKVKDLGLTQVLNEWLNNIYVMDTVSEALSKRKELPNGGIFVTKSGHIVSRVGVQVYAEDNEQAGLIARAKEIEDLEKQLKSDLMMLEEAQLENSSAKSNYQAAYAQAQEDRLYAQQAVKDAHRFEVETMQLRQAEIDYFSKAEQLNISLQEAQNTLEEHAGSLLENAALSEEITAQLDELASTYEILQNENQALIASREMGMQKRQDMMTSVQEASFTLRSLKQRQVDLTKDIQTAQEQLEIVQQKTLQNQLELEQVSSIQNQDRLQDLLEQRSESEESLTQARTIFDGLMFDIKAFDENRLTTERDINPIRERITAAQLKEQAARLTVEQFAALLEEAQANIDAISQLMNEGVKVNQLQSQVNDIQRSIQSLGPVNMAALDELKSSRERKGFLDAQSADLNEAIQTLTDAILKIDGETRELLQGTFDEVNKHFALLFPALFGGGNAKLVMTGDEILDSGVQVMAQPPGKKNSTIHLLSGGEKALTAIALIFSMFQLNPAPFCLLDEVDAPLDDANTARYADIVAKMSKNTQFLFISHNKITMEIANQLIGVTMQEQGVSRVVAVDLQSATNLLQIA